MNSQQLWHDLERRTNLRQLGGYRTSDGKTIKSGLLFRSGQLSELNADDLEMLRTLDLRYIFDFRTDSEQQLKPNPVIIGAENVSLPALGGAVNPQELLPYIRSMGEAAKQGGLLIGAYKQFVSNDAAQKAYRRFFEGLLETEGKPLLWHCAAGKDRTGFAAAILLLALDVPRETVMDDYLRSNRNRIEANNQWVDAIRQKIGDVEELGVFREMMSVDAVYLQEALNEAEERYGTLNAYMESVLGLTAERREQFKKIYLEQALV
ncbi:tyrosine-protein phosphatase [Paenibacillus sp. FSL H7-0357]|uniref:tyrosine-protein phosphatase n=1 Tax=unclassified Paenibacillus TaxID=185978 RepID=UPI00068FFF90|nr:tyrosine-protein phosphatase [Paenibacillus sp. FSL H7-0357]